MVLFYILLIILVLSRFEYKRRGFYTEYMSLDTTNSIKGVFIALVFIKHATPYILNSNYTFDNSIWSRAFMLVDENVGQWIVVMFLFYSGYGIMESIKKKGSNYINSIPHKRILTVLINFDIAVALFAVISLFTPNNYTLKNYLLSFTGWDSVGNSNWYIFIIMLCYLITYISFRITANKHNDTYIHTYANGAIICITLLLLSIVLLSYLKQSWWYDTMLCFGFGITFSILRSRIETATKRHYWSILVILFLLLFCLNAIPFYARGLIYNTYCIVFCMSIVMLTMKFSINNPILVWCGKNLFPLYIYQRIPMIIFLPSVVVHLFHPIRCFIH